MVVNDATCAKPRPRRSRTARSTRLFGIAPTGITMATYGDFSSLLQLGVGIGIGISLFRAPVDLRVSRLERIIDGEIAVLRGTDVPFGQKKRRDMMDLRFQFMTVRAKLDRWQWPFMAAAVIGALANLAGLIVATLDKDGVVCDFGQWTLLFVSIGWYFILLLALEILARVTLRSVRRDFSAIQTRRAPDVSTFSEGGR